MSLFFCVCLNVPQGQPVSPTAGPAPGSAGGRGQEVLLGFPDDSWSTLVMGDRAASLALQCVKHVGGGGNF